MKKLPLQKSLQFGNYSSTAENVMVYAKSVFCIKRETTDKNKKIGSMNTNKVSKYMFFIRLYCF